MKEGSLYNWRSPSDATQVSNEPVGTAAWFGAEPDSGSECMIFAGGGRLGDVGCAATTVYALCECSFSHSNFISCIYRLPRYLLYLPILYYLDPICGQGKGELARKFARA